MFLSKTNKDTELCAPALKLSVRTNIESLYIRPVLIIDKRDSHRYVAYSNQTIPSIGS
jgi:hypothetical protein